MTTRRDFVRNAALASAASLVATSSASAVDALAVDAFTDTRGDAHRSVLPPKPAGEPQDIAQDDEYWRKVAAMYKVTDRTTNLEAGFFGMMASPVLAAYHENIDRVNRESSYFARREYPALFAASRERVATALGVKPGEIAFSRGATEALQALIGQYKGVGSGDAVMYADLDYNSMQYAMNALAERRGASVVQIEIPEPVSKESLLDLYERALTANPRTKLLLLTHCNNKTGLILPVREIAELARARGVDVVLDAAHSFGQVPLALPELGVDFVGLNLHKWIGAPVGAGVMYVREGRLSALERAHGDPGSLERIDSRLHTGTTDFATVMTIPHALDFQDSIGVPNKSARLRMLRDRWALKARAVSGVDVLSPDEPGMVGAITGFRIRGNGTREANQAIARTLLDEFGLFTVWRTGLAKGDCVRVTMALYNSPADADRLVDALKSIAERAGN